MISSFTGLTDDDVLTLRAADPAFKAIRNLVENGHEVTFAWLRSQFGANTDNWEKIDRGRAVLRDVDQLSQYLYTHGLMIKSQWDHVLKPFSDDGQPKRVVDYGCGQGLAGIFLASSGVKSPLRNAREIVLIEPSPVALVRAEAVYRALAPNSNITCVCKKFDDVEEGELAYDGGLETLHVFSNVLDINGYDRFALLSKALTVGRHTILAVSHDRDHDGGSERIHSLDRVLKDPKLADEVVIRRSNIEKFKCNNGKSDTIYWYCELDVKNG